MIDRLAADLRREFPEMTSLSRTNLKYMRSFAEAYPGNEIGQQAVGQIPWGHNIVLFTKLNKYEERLWYAAQTVEHRWSRSVLVHQIESGLYARQGVNQLRQAGDQPSIGLILCKEWNRVVVQYALRGTNQPIGVAEYRLTEILPQALRGAPPTRR